MGMTREQFSLVVEGINAIYPDKIKDKAAFDVWYKLLKDLDYETVSMATQHYMRTEHFPPVPADIRNKAIELATMVEGEDGEIEAWNMVRKAIQNSAYNSVEEFSKLPELIQRTIGSPDQLRTWALTDGEQLETVIASNFMRVYRAKLTQKKEWSKLPQETRNRLVTIRQNAMISEVSDVQNNK